MKRFKPIGLLLLAIFALAAFAASTASAEEGFLPKQETSNLLGGTSTLEVEGAVAILCKTLDESKFTSTSDKHSTGTIHWLGCKAGGIFTLNSLGDASEVILVPTELLVCLDPKNAEGKLLANFGVAGEVKGVHLESPATGTLIEINGRFLGTIEGTKGKLIGSRFEGSKGKQTVAKCLEGANEKTHNLTSSENHGAAKPVSENVVGGLLQFPAEVELMDS